MVISDYQIKDPAPGQWSLLKAESQVKLGMGHMASGLTADFNYLS